MSKGKKKEMEEKMADFNEEVEILDEEVETQEESILEQEEEIAQDLVDIQNKLVEQENLAKDYLDKLQRTMAEYDNFRKRTVKEKSTMYENGAREVLEKIIPVVDNFERALAHLSEEEKNSNMAQGVDMIYKQLSGVIKDLGVEVIEALGSQFDPNLHYAVAHEDNDAYGDNEVIEVMQKGYVYKERVLRCSMVKVAN